MRCGCFGLALKSQAFVSDGQYPERDARPNDRRPGPAGEAKEKTMLRNLKVFVVALLVMVAIGAAYAFAATNTVPESAAGYKANVVPGYTVTNLIYDLDATDPTIVDAILFDITPSSGSAAAALVKVQTANSGSWTDCSLSAGTLPTMRVTCAFGALALTDVTALNIVASSTTDPAP